MVSQTFASWNHTAELLRRVDGFGSWPEPARVSRAGAMVNAAALSRTYRLKREVQRSV